MVLLIVRWVSSFRPSQLSYTASRFATVVKSSSENTDVGAKTNTNKNFRDDFQGTRIFVQNLPPNCDWKQLKDHFKSAGSVVYASVSCDPVTKASKGHGIVQYETTNEANHALATMNNVLFKTAHLQLRPDIQERRKEKTTPAAGAHWSTQPPKVKKTAAAATVRPGDKPRENVMKERLLKKVESKDISSPVDVAVPKVAESTTTSARRIEEAPAAKSRPAVKAVVTLPRLAKSTIGPSIDSDSEDEEEDEPVAESKPIVKKIISRAATIRKSQILNLLDNEPEIEEETEVEETESKTTELRSIGSTSTDESTAQHEFVRIKKNAAIKYAKQASGIWTADPMVDIEPEEAALIQSIVMEREALRNLRQFDKADEIRMALRREKRVQLNDAKMEWRILPEQTTTL
jgi:RNA recognition motif. (a.k.a. RRM, RBD, or RNP domain)